MGRNKHRRKSLPAKRRAKQPGGSKDAASTSVQRPKKSRPQMSTKPTVPFSPEDHVLLVGEGDFSFAQAVIDHHGVSSLTATSYDSREEVLQKYPQAADHVARLQEQDCQVLHGIDAGKLEKVKRLKKKRFDKIIFMFPHVGGLSTDQDRQIRSNQELLLRFFNSARRLLRLNGTITVTLFDGLPYSLWDVRALAKSAGLQSQRSFVFQSDAYPGYRHARTLGNIDGENAWRGEARDARSYVFEMQKELVEQQESTKPSRNPPNNSSDED